MHRLLCSNSARHLHGRVRRPHVAVVKTGRRNDWGLSVIGPYPWTPVSGVQRMASPPVVPNDRLDKNKNRTHAAMSREFRNGLQAWRTAGHVERRQIATSACGPPA